MRMGDRISGEAILREGLMVDERLYKELPSMPPPPSRGASLREATRFRERLDAALLRADRAGTRFPAIHGDALMDAADALVAEAAMQERRALAFPRRRRRPTTDELREALGLAEDNRRQ